MSSSATSTSVKHTFCWIDIPVTDLQRAINFYTVVLGEKIEKMAEHGCEFGLLPHTENNVSGCLSVMENRKPSTDGPLVYLNVEGRIDQAIAEATKNGGKLLMEKHQIGPYGFRAIVLDTEGNAIALHSK